LQQVERFRQHVIGRHRHQRGYVEGAGEIAQPADARPVIAATGAAGALVQRIEQDGAAAAQVAVDVLDGGVRERRLARRNRPVEEWEERELVGLDIDAHGRAGLDGRAIVQHGGQADQAGAAGGVEFGMPVFT
jgi:hypothetical protein